MVRESDTGYICNMEIYSDERKSLDETVLSILGPNLELWHHVYQDNYYNSVLIANTLLEHKTRVCGTIRVNRGLPQSLQDEASTLKKGEIVFRRKGDILLLIWKDAREVRMISTIHDASFCSTGRKNRDSGEEIIKPMCIVQYNAYMKGLDLADQYFSYCNILRKSAKWTKNVVLYLINCGLFNSFKIFQTLNPQSKIKYKQFLLVVARDWITPKGTEESIDLESNISGPSNIGSKRPPCKDHPQRLSGNMKQHIPVKIPSSEKKKFPTKVCRVCVTHGKRSETRYICKFCAVPLHIGECFTKYHILKKY
ncbi:piggyBac transposable element-derived protein 4 isoform X4 [Ptiloglossa arizonensis]